MVQNNSEKNGCTGGWASADKGVAKNDTSVLHIPINTYNKGYLKGRPKEKESAHENFVTDRTFRPKKRDFMGKVTANYVSVNDKSFLKNVNSNYLRRIIPRKKEPNPVPRSAGTTSTPAPLLDDPEKLKLQIEQLIKAADYLRMYFNALQNAQNTQLYAGVVVNLWRYLNILKLSPSKGLTPIQKNDVSRIRELVTNEMNNLNIPVAAPPPMGGPPMGGPPMGGPPMGGPPMGGPPVGGPPVGGPPVGGPIVVSDDDDDESLSFPFSPSQSSLSFSPTPESFSPSSLLSQMSEIDDMIDRRLSLISLSNLSVASEDPSISGGVISLPERKDEIKDMNEEKYDNLIINKKKFGDISDVDRIVINEEKYPPPPTHPKPPKPPPPTDPKPLGVGPDPLKKGVLEKQFPHLSKGFLKMRENLIDSQLSKIKKGTTPKKAMKTIITGLDKTKVSKDIADFILTPSTSSKVERRLSKFAGYDINDVKEMETELADLKEKYDMLTELSEQGNKEARKVLYEFNNVHFDNLGNMAQTLKKKLLPQEEKEEKEVPKEEKERLPPYVFKSEAGKRFPHKDFVHKFETNTPKEVIRAIKSSVMNHMERTGNARNILANVKEEEIVSTIYQNRFQGGTFSNIFERMIDGYFDVNYADDYPTSRDKNRFTRLVLSYYFTDQSKQDIDNVYVDLKLPKGFARLRTGKIVN